MLLALIIFAEFTHLLAFHAAHLAFTLTFPVHILSFEWIHSFTASWVSSHIVKRLIMETLIQALDNFLGLFGMLLLLDAATPVSRACDWSLVISGSAVVHSRTTLETLLDIPKILIVLSVWGSESILSISALATFHIGPPSSQRSVLIIVIFVRETDILIDFFHSICLFFQLPIKVFYGGLSSIFQQMLNSVESHIWGTTLVSVAPAQIGINGHCRLHIRQPSRRQITKV